MRLRWIMGRVLLAFACSLYRFIAENHSNQDPRSTQKPKFSTFSLPVLGPDDYQLVPLQ